MAKIKFVTGGDDCACGGSGTIVHRFVRELIADGKKIGEEVTLVRGDCSCVVTREATVEHTETFYANAGGNNRNGRIVPVDE